MKTQYKIVFLSIVMAVPAALNAQVLITLLLGDALNSEKIEFGMTDGFNGSYMSTDVLVNSNVGATGMPTYPIGDEDFDAVYEAGILTKRIKCYYGLVNVSAVPDLTIKNSAIYLYI